MKNNKRILIFIAVLCSAGFFLGCGYHFRADGAPMGTGISSLAIPMMESTSTSKNFEGDFTTVLREEFIRHANVPLVPRQQAHMILMGKISEIRTEPLTYNMTESSVNDKTTYYEVTNSRRLWVRLDAKLLERATGKIVWETEGMEAKARYELTADPLTNQHNQKRALQVIAQRLADRIYLKTMERF